MIVVAEYRDQHSVPTLNHSALHDWWAEVDRFTGVSHSPDLTRGGLIALLGAMALAAGIKVKNPQDAVPQLVLWAFPDWFAGFCFAAIALA